MKRKCKLFYYKTFWLAGCKQQRENHYFHNPTHRERYRSKTLSSDLQNLLIFDGAYLTYLCGFFNQMGAEQFTQTDNVLPLYMLKLSKEMLAYYIRCLIFRLVVYL